MNHQIGFIGLGKMGKNMVLRLLEQGIDVVGFNRTLEVTQQFNNRTIEQFRGSPKVGTFTPTQSIEEMIDKLLSPRVVFFMVPNGQPVDEVLQQLTSFGIQKGDIVIDGGNTYYKDTVRRAKALADRGIVYLDCGTSGGLDGARHGACLMIGGAEAQVQKLEWLWNALSQQGDPLQDHALRGWEYFGPTGAGHFVKMVHNGVEYGMNEAIGEGFEILSKSPYRLDFAKVAHAWSHGSVVRGWLVELLAEALDKDPSLARYSGRVGGGETGKWAIEAAKEGGVSAPVIEDALKAREKSLQKPTFAGKVVSALRAGYGGHKEPGK